MALFFATCSRHDITPIKNLRYKNVLSSYFYYRKGKYREYYLKNKHLYDNFFMDSGAFSFHNLKVDIDIDEYIDTIKKDSIDNYSVLDVIGDPKATQENYLYMKSKDLDPTPCFHINTEIEYLDYYLEECDKLAIGGMVQAQNIHSNLKKIWSKIFNLGNDKATKKQKRRPRFTLKQLKKIFDSHLKPVYKTKAEQCPICRGKGTVQKIKINGSPYKKFK